MGSAPGRSIAWSKRAVILVYDLYRPPAVRPWAIDPPRPVLLLFRGQGGRPGLHAETASRGSEPVGSPTRSKKIHLAGFETIPIVFESSVACRTDPRIEADPSIEVHYGRHIVKARRTRPNTSAEGRGACRTSSSATASAPRFLRSSDSVRIRGSRATAPRLHVGRRQLSGGHPTISG
jgi:hypothetical protein